MYLRQSVTNDLKTSNVSWLYLSDVVVTRLPDGRELAVSYNPENWKTPRQKEKNNERHDGKK